MPYRIHHLREFDHPDLSPFVIHFTGRLGQRTPNVPVVITALTPVERMIGIVQDRRILAHSMFQTPDPVVCFTECTKVAIEKLVRDGRYERVGIAFRKNTLFQRGGGPAFYVRGDVFEGVEALPPEIRAFCTRYWPGAVNDEPWSTYDNFLDPRSEWIHEREWRVRGVGDPGAFTFSYSEVAFFLVPDTAFSVQLQSLVTAPHPQAAEFARIPHVVIDPAGQITDQNRVWIR